jgi:AraC-like DNA-binding protein
VIVKTFLPSLPLSSFVEKYVIVETETERINRLLPGTSIALAFRLEGKTEYMHNDSATSLPVSVISGLRRTPRFVKYAPKSSSLIVLFKTATINFFRHPVNALFEESLSLDEVIDRSAVHRIEDQLASCSRHYQRIEVVEKFLLSQLRYTHDSMIARALSRISDENGNLRIKDLAKSLHISQDAFEKRFRKTVGCSPKQFSIITRMKSAIHAKTSGSVTNLALTSGYFDSAHFNKEFKLFTGQTPKEFYSTPLPW